MHDTTAVLNSGLAVVQVNAGAFAVPDRELVRGGLVYLNVKGAEFMTFGAHCEPFITGA